MFVGGSTYSGLSAGAGSSAASSAGGSSGAHAGGASSASSAGGAGGSSSSSVAFANALAEANDLDALVFEFGTAKCKLGFAGEDFPRVYESPLAPEHAHDRRRAARMESDPEAVAQWLFDAASTRLQTRLSEHPLLLVERPFALPDEFRAPRADASEGDATATPVDDPSSSSSSSSGATTTGKKRDGKARERMVEVLMETLDLPALFGAKSAVLACYANARTSGLVVEMGATYTSVTSVHEGYAFAYPKSTVQLYGGYDLDAFLRAKLEPQLARLAPSPSTRTSKFYWSLATEAKESGLCRVADGPFDEAQNAQLPKIGYELPDKTVVQLGTERFSVGEQFFTPRAAEPTATDPGAAVVTEFDKTETAMRFGVKRGLALPELVCETGAMTTEAELRKELFQNIVLTGGSSSFENLPTRLEREVVVALSSVGGAANGGFAMAPGFGSTRVKLIAAHAQERRIGSFLGGSILASLGSFHEMWLSKAEYAEHGAALIHKKCP